MVRGIRSRLFGLSCRFAGACVLYFALVPGQLQAQEAKPRAHEVTLKLTKQQQEILNDAREELRSAILSDAERQVRINAVEAVLTGTVGSPDDDNPEVRNPNLWTLADDGYVVAPNSTAVEAIADLWIVHDNDGVPVPRIWCAKYSSLVMAKAYIQYFRDKGQKEGLATLNDLIGHKVFPGDLPNRGEGVLWTRRPGNANLLPGDQVWFKNPYFDKGRSLLKEIAYNEAIREGKPAEEASAFSEKSANSLAVAEEGSNVFYLGNNLVARGAVSMVRGFRGSVRGAGQDAALSYDQIYTKKIFTIPRYRQHIIECFFTVRACVEADPTSVQPSDFQIRCIRSLLDPDTLLHPDPQTVRMRQLDRLIDAMASRNQEPKSVASDDGRIPLFSKDYDWREQDRVRAAMLVVLQTTTDDMWWRLREHFDDHRYVLTASWNGSAENFSVGAFCYDFANADLAMPYEQHLPAVAGQLPASFHPEDVFWKNQQEWARVGKPLYEIQIAVCERAMEQWASVHGTVAGKEGRSHTYTADEKARFIKAVEDEITQLKSKKKPVFIEAVLPCAAAPSGWEGFDADSAQDVHEQLQRKAFMAVRGKAPPVKSPSPKQ